MDSRSGWSTIAAVLAMLMSACTSFSACAAADAPPAPAAAPASGQASQAAPGAPWPGSVRARALSALQRAQTLTLYSLQPTPKQGTPEAWDLWSLDERGQRMEEFIRQTQREWCRGHDCIDSNRVLGSIEVGAADRPLVFKAAREALANVPSYGFICEPIYRHAVAFADGGHRYQVLLSHRCDQIKILVDGKGRCGNEQTTEMKDMAAIDAVLTRAAVALDPTVYP